MNGHYETLAGAEGRLPGRAARHADRPRTSTSGSRRTRGTCSGGSGSLTTRDVVARARLLAPSDWARLARLLAARLRPGRGPALGGHRPRRRPRRALAGDAAAAGGAHDRRLRRLAAGAGRHRGAAMTEPRLTAAVLTYDGRHLLETALPSFAAQTLRDYRLLVVDNGSRDDTLEWLAANHPHADVVAIPENIGVTAALNRVLAGGRHRARRAASTTTSSSTRAVSRSSSRAMDAHPEAGSAGAKLVDFHDRGVLDGAGDVFDWGGTGDAPRPRRARPRAVRDPGGDLRRLRRRRDLPPRGARARRPVRRALLRLLRGRRLGLPRAARRATRCRYVPTAVVYHMGSATIGAGMSDFTRYQLYPQRGVGGGQGLSAGCAAAPPARAWSRPTPGELIPRGAVAGAQLGVWLRAWRDALREAPGGAPRPPARASAGAGRRAPSWPP